MFAAYYLDSQGFSRSRLGYTLLGGNDAVEGEHEGTAEDGSLEATRR
jgi:hypothetical protein